MCYVVKQKNWFKRKRMKTLKNINDLFKIGPSSKGNNNKKSLKGNSKGGFY